MATARSTAEALTTPEYQLPRSVRLIRAVVLFLGGMAITFTATMHEQLSFDQVMASVVLGVIGVAHAIEWLARRRVMPSSLPLVLAVVSIIAAIFVSVVTTPIAFAMIVAGWALVSALVEFIGSAVNPGSRQDATLLGAIGVLLSLLVLVFRNDQVAIIGLFGAYAIIAGVFLGISAFDTRRAAHTAASDSSDAPTVASEAP